MAGRTVGSAAPVSPPADLRLPTPSEPEVSVVVLAWRLTDGLVDCLTALSRSADAPSFETIIVLNGADAAVRAAAARIAGARTVDIPVNVGYGDGCNAGAEIARGRHLVFLNDDALVDPGWLRALTEAADADERIGAVGALILEADGATVQEVGSRMAANGHPRPWGRESTLAAAEADGLLRPRAVDFASGAALLVRRDAFARVGGFDPAYRPAYYEDVDLCLRLRQRGWDVVTEPRARVRHASGGSTSADPHFRRFAIEHAREVFRTRWAPTLAAAPSPDAPGDALCDPGLSPVPPAERPPQSPERVALGIAWDYQAWIRDRLDRLEMLERVALPRLESLEHEAADIRTRGPLGLARWRVGVWRRARRQTEEQRADIAAIHEPERERSDD